MNRSRKTTTSVRVQGFATVDENLPSKDISLCAWQAAIVLANELVPTQAFEMDCLPPIRRPGGRPFQVATVIPEKYRETVMEQAHGGMTGGH